MLIQAMMYYLLMVQCVITFFLSIPYGNRTCQRVVEWLDKSIGKLEVVKRAVQFSFFVILLMFIQALLQTQSYYGREEFTTDTRNRQLLAQRDAYIAGFNLFIFALLRLVYKNLQTTNQMTASAEALKKQATNLQAEYKRLSDENEKQNSDLDTLKKLVKEKDGEFDLEGFLNTNSELKSQVAKNEKSLAEREKEIKSLKTNMDVLKKQAESQGNIESLQMDAYNKLVDENKSLKEQLKELDLKVAEKDGNKKND